MFGKLAAITSYMKIWDVYLIKRFPSNKLSIWGMMLSYSLCAWFFTRVLLTHRTNSLRKMRTNNYDCHKCPISKGWSFNPLYVKQDSCCFVDKKRL